MKQKCDIRNYLDEYEKELVREGKRLEEELKSEGIPSLTVELFSQFERTGNRIEYENVYFKRRKYFSVYAILSTLYKKSSDINLLEEVIMSICDEECWALPAHVSRTDENWMYTIDLFAAETAFSLAEIICLLSNELSENVKERAKHEVFKRVLIPFMKGGKPYAWWENSQMNWCAVCCGCIGSAAIWLMQDDKKRLDELVERISASIMNYVDGFGDDGVCLEGLGYYTYGMSFFMIYADLVYKYSKGHIDLLEGQKLEKMALFQQNCFLPGNVAISFSDSISDERYRVGLTAFLKSRFKNVEFPDVSLAAGLESDNCYRYGVLSRDIMWTREYLLTDSCGEVIDNTSDTGFRHIVFDDAQWSICANENKYAVAVKGGHNDEPHNHNDVGSFMLVYDGEVVISDVGSGEYTKDYFGEKRYEYLCCSSIGHSVPIIDEGEQLAGKQYNARYFEADGLGKTVIELAGAYGLSEQESIRRTVLLTKDAKECIVNDSFKLQVGRSVTENLVTTYEADVYNNGFMIHGENHNYVVAVTGGVDYRVISERYMDHFGVERKAYRLCWKVTNFNSQSMIMLSSMKVNLYIF